LRLLAIESSCDETACAVVEDRRVRSNLVASQAEEHALYGGVVPEIASRRHTEAISALCSSALEQAGVSLRDCDGVAVTAAPGLVGALLVGLHFAKGLCAASGLPLVPVHHLRAHVAANYLAHPQLEPPFLALLVSGGHTNLLEVRDYLDYRVLGRTRDDAAGECFDKSARAMGLPYPGGAALDALAAGSSASGGDASAVPLPSPRVEGNELDFSFSGLKTAVVNLLHKYEQRGETPPRTDIAAALRARVCDMLVSRTMLAACHTGLRQIALAGGVAANGELRRRMADACAHAGCGLFIPPPELCGDNAAMVGAQGVCELAGIRASDDAGRTAALSVNAYASWPVEEPLPLA